MRIYLVLLSVLSLLLFSCRPTKDPVFNGIQNVRMDRVGLAKSTISLDMNFFNPNHRSGKLKSAEGEAWMDSIYLGKFIVDTTIWIPSNADFIVPVKLQIDMKTLLKNSLTMLTKTDPTFTIKGVARAGTKGIFRNINLSYKGKQNLEKLLSPATEPDN